ncbi:hypothetical protein A2V56_03295 [Candidatus Woesebacteria bacterium RBG_19FT_COMBO_42_9]|uniref:LytR/CpsA/Psr regulator C-terminal domain-containing protein n=1 Tax=Candidatus Woesebacteria bacterium RBG_16_42_24 TaxID=1802485 RepID=A0A1F7XM23_9BACT|nr:MAG: hypothetical protein A2V97_01810 [Candidatus Woesebacteria bacterium RBG_16_42_24]OGM16400.1 MAG: hypothetical protein A2V56_03295 [Candidatus Woesebacteria bacterium RBG_19FT_COMBO_42_9]OGM67331.1 MAG: hypothetical protein A2985_04215 [Candidatus Woesebacteria bacterium RIFCSPLOWO2_01_FULL_43_11]
MHSARKTRLKDLKVRRQRKFGFGKLIIFGLFASVAIWLFTSSNHFAGENKLTITSPIGEGDVLVVTFDRKVGEVTSIKIPGDTEVSVAGQLGNWRIKSVWQLGINEGVGGRLLAETVTKNFKFPVNAWTDSQGLGLMEESLAARLKAVFYPYDTNLGLGDKISLALFSLGVRNFDRVEVDLSDSSYLKKTRLKDGNEGYMITSSMPQNLIVVFADSEMAVFGVRIILKNFSGDKTLSNDVAGVLEVLGGKVAASVDEQAEDKDCEVLAKKEIFAQKISRLFDCQIINEDPEGNFDLEVRVGRQFAKRF